MAEEGDRIGKASELIGQVNMHGVEIVRTPRKRSAAPLHWTLALILVSSLSQGQEIAIEARCEPSSIVNDGTARVVVKILAREFSGGVLTIDGPTSSGIKSLRQDLPRFSGGIVRIVDLGGLVTSLGSGSWTGVATVTLGESDKVKGATIASTSFSFSTASELSMVAYLLIGAMGTFLGWVLKQCLDSLATVRPRPFGAPEEPPHSRLDRWIAEHFFFVDGATTVLLALLALVALSKGGRPPEAGSQWYSALMLGSGLGLLTNADLLTRLRR